MRPLQKRLVKTTRIIKSLTAIADAKRTISQKLADLVTTTFGSVTFLAFNIAWFTAWIAINVGLVPGVAIFDPYPFGLLTTIVSLEAIILAVFVLISQNREQKINDLRDEIDLEIDSTAEAELSKLLELLGKIAQKVGIDVSKDLELKQMLKPLDKEKMEQDFEEEML